MSKTRRETFNGFEVTITDSSEEVLEALKTAERRALEAIGMAAEAHAKEDPNMPVDTGRARNSITWATKSREGQSYTYTAKLHNGKTEIINDTIGNGAGENDVYIGSNVEYFPQIENGGIHMSARHVLQNAATGHTEEYRGIVEDSLRNA